VIKNASALAFICISAFGCAGADRANDRVNPEVPMWFHRPAGAIQVAFHRTLTAPSKTTGEAYERGRAEIDLANKRVFVGSSDHGLYALRAADGSSIWRYETLSVVQSEPLYDGELDVVYFGSHDGALYCVRAQDGQLVWRYDAGAEVAKRPVVYGETLFVATAADYLFAIDRRSGKTKWQAHRTSAMGMEISGYAGPAVDRGLVYMAYSDGNVIAYDIRDGSEKWTPVDLSADAEQTAGETLRFLDVDTTPVFDDLPNGRAVFVASYAGGVVALDAKTGARLWANEKVTGANDLLLWKEPAHMPSPRGPQAGDPEIPARSILIASSGTTGMWALDPKNGRMLWRNPLPEGGVTAPVPVAGALLVGTTRYGLFLISPLNGKVIDSIDFGGGFAQTPAAAGIRAYAMTNAGTFLSIQIDSPLARSGRSFGAPL